jgi:arabinosaccharide transport system substrate-binding protein
VITFIQEEYKALPLIGRGGIEMKKGFVISLILSFLIALVGCSGANKDDGRTTITLWTFADTHKQFYDEMKIKYEEEHPDVKIKIELLEHAAMNDKYTVVAQSGGKDAPDLIDIEQGAFPRYIKGDIPFEPLNSYLDPVGLTTAIPQGRMDLYTVDSNIYGIEIAACVAALYYRKDLYDAAGIDVTTLKTWDEFMAASKPLIGKDKYIMSGSEKDFGTFESMLRQEGGDIVTASGEIGFNTDKGKLVMNRIQAWKDQGLMSKTSPEGPQFWEGYTKGNYVAAIGPDWWAGQLVQNAPDLAGKWAAVPMPLGGPDSVQTTVLGGTGLSVSKFSKNKEIAFEFLRYTHLDTENVVRSFQIINLFPALTSAAESEALHQESAMTKYFGDQDLAALYADLSKQAPSQNQAWWRSLVGKAWDKYEPDFQKGKITPDDFLANVETELKSLIATEEAREAK